MSVKRLTEKLTTARSNGKPIELETARREVALEITELSSQLSSDARGKAQAFADETSTLRRITRAIGDTAEKISLIIAMACVIGRCLLVSGAAERIVRGALGLVGPGGAPLAFAASSFVLGIPVFFDSVFLLVIPLAKAMWLKLRKDYLLFVLALVTGGTMTHSLVPPTPGPLFVAEELGVNMGLMILVGLSIGLCCTFVGLLYARWLNQRIQVPVRDSPAALAQLEQLSNRPIEELPSLWLSLLPVLLPVGLISGSTVYASSIDPGLSVPAVFELLGNQNIALSLSAVLALMLAAKHLGSRQALAEQIQLAMQEAGTIILVCCAGGAFGATLEQSGIGPYISQLVGSGGLDFGLLPLAFLVTAIVRGAQGSSTVAMFTAVAIVRSLVPDTEVLSYHPVYLAVSIGCGSKPFPWMNDSGFWVISKMSGMTEQETLKTHTPMVTLMGFTGIAVTMLAAKLVPLIG
jgi:GntP family gluconate:H+ symporter